MAVTKKWQVRVFILCWIAYAGIYFGRVNLSVAIPEIQCTLGYTKGQIGMIGSLFFWIYGIGQLINGSIGDRVSSRKFIFIGLLVTGLVNIGFGFTQNIGIMMFLWAINGYFQSMLWGPVVKTLSSWFPEKERGRVAIGISTSMAGGFILVWGLSGIILMNTDWRWVFFVLGVLIVIYAIVWYAGIRNKPEDVGMQLEGDEHSDSDEKSFNTSQVPDMTLWQVIKKTQLWYVVVACFAQGIIKEGIALWGPTYMFETHHLDMKATTGMILLIPFMNLFGMYLANRINEQLKGQEKLAAMLLLAAGMVMTACLVAFGHHGVWVSLIFLSLSSAMMYGANTILLGVIPIGFARYNKASSISGFLDFSSYMAAGISASLTGFIVSRWGWSGVMFMWIGITVLGILSLIISWRADAYKLTALSE